MTFNQIWDSLVAKSEGKLAKENGAAEFKAANLKALLRQVYDQGHKEGSKLSAKNAKNNDFMSMFNNGMFG